MIPEELSGHLEAQGLGIAFDTTPLIPTEGWPLDPATTRRYEERIARTFQVPYWVMLPRPKPSWFSRPIWRLRALYWRCT